MTKQCGSDSFSFPSASTAEEIKHYLRNLGLRPTRQRLRVFTLLTSVGDGHLNACDVYRLLYASGDRLALATVYNILNDFVEVGLLRRISFLRNQMVFDTNTSPHHHIIDSDSGTIIDTDSIDYVLTNQHLPIGVGKKIVSVEITITVSSERKDDTGDRVRNLDV
ncbi:MAG: Fur family transcriptional regulator [Ktedonobacteraceae bacterium]